MSLSFCNLVELLLYFYRSSVVASLLNARGYALIPSLVMERLEIIAFLKLNVMCRSSIALPAEITNIRLVGVAQQELMFANLFTSLYLDVNSSVTFTPQLVRSHDLVARQMISGEIDVGLINLNNVEAVLLEEFLSSDDFLILPFFAQALGWLVNPQLSETILLPTNQPFNVSSEMLLRFVGGCDVEGYGSSGITDANPWLLLYLANQSIPMEFIWACDGADVMGNVLSSKAYLRGMTSGLWGDPSDKHSFAWCFSDANPAFSERQIAYKSCSVAPEHHLRYVTDEHVAPSLIIGIFGGSGVGMADTDPSKIWAHFPVTHNGKVVNWVPPKFKNIAACLENTFNPATSRFDIDKSPSLECYPYSQTVAIAVRKNYYSSTSNSSSCQRGLDALKLVRWLTTTRAMDQLLLSTNKVLVPQSQGLAAQTYLDALNAVLCDSETLLITLPIVWELSEGVVGFGYAAASIGMFVTALYMAFVIVYRRHPVIRASSPLFMLTSLFGIMMMFGAIIALIQPATESSCSALAWMFSVGLMVTFAPLFAKAYRVWKIFGGKKLSVVKISNHKLMVIVLALFAVEAILMIVWQAVAPLEPLLSDELQNGRQHQYMQCSAEGTSGSFLVVVAIEKGFLLLGGALLGFSTRKVSSQFNESAFIAVSIYNTVFSIGVIGGIMGAIDMNGDARAALMLVAVLWISFFTGAVLVLPKALHVFNPEDKNAIGIVCSSGNSSSGFSFISINVFTSLPMVNSYLAALRRHVEQIEHRQVHLRGGPSLSQTQKKRSETPPTGSRNGSVVSAYQPPFISTPNHASSLQAQYNESSRVQRRNPSYDLQPSNKA